jgi:Ser/Thr protein kinase RdoA (MazF antagonist)
MRKPQASSAALAAGAFDFRGDLVSVSPFGTGHINESHVVTLSQAGRRVRYLMQLVNTSVFRDPEALMGNVVRVTEHIRRRLAGEGARDLSRRTLKVIPSRDGENWWRDPEGGFWRAYLFIEGAVASEIMDSPEAAFSLGEAVGRFQCLLADLPGPRLAETIPHFHDARARYAAFEAAVAADRAGRAGGAGAEIDFFRENRERCDRIVAALESGSVPERVTHNDAKIQNLLIDRRSGEAICVIDLDTVMPGATAHDFGDLARTVPASVAEDEADASRMEFLPAMYAALARGYARGSSAFLSAGERELLPWGGRIVTIVQGLRFLTDYLDGDRYYRISRPDHNLLRARTQMALARSMERHWGEMRDITAAAFDSPPQ